MENVNQLRQYSRDFITQAEVKTDNEANCTTTQPTEAEAIELKRLYDILSKSLCRDDDVAYGLAVARMRALLKEMEKKKP